MIRRFTVRNYKALHDVSLGVAAMHAVIGPNDSGKTSILQAIAALCRSVDRPLQECFTGSWEGRDLVWQRQPVPVMLGAEISDGEGVSGYELECQFDAAGTGIQARGEVYRTLELGDETSIAFGNGTSTTRVGRLHATRDGEPELVAAADRVHDALSGVQFCRWNPRVLALPVAAQGQRRFWLHESGFGLALLLEDILGENRASFAKIEEEFRRIFPHITSIKLHREPAFTAPETYRDDLPEFRKLEGKGLHFGFSEGHVLPASQVSDGVILVLAYITLLNLPKPPRVVLVEEPENGVHPKRLAEVLSVLRSLVAEGARTQVIITTHSPYVVDLFEREAVSLCRRGDDGGVVLTRLSESDVVSRQSGVFTLGEIWTGEGDEALTGADQSADAPGD